MLQVIIYTTSEHNVSKNHQNKVFSTVLCLFDLSVTLRWSHHDLGITPQWNQTPTDVIMCTWFGSRPIYWKCWSNNVLSTLLNWFNIAVTFRCPYHDLGITPLWNPTPTHFTMCTWLGFRPIYFYTTQGFNLPYFDDHTSMILFMHSKSADHLKVTWYIMRFEKIWCTTITSGGGGGGVHVGPMFNKTKICSPSGCKFQILEIIR